MFAKQFYLKLVSSNKNKSFCTHCNTLLSNGKLKLTLTACITMITHLYHLYIQ